MAPRVAATHLALASTHLALASTRMKDLATIRIGRATRAVPRVGTGVVLVPPSLDAATARAASTFVGRLPDRYVPFAVFVYGSRARGDHRPDSDADLAVVLKGQPGDRIAIGMEMAAIAVDVLRETGILVEALPFWECEFERPDQSRNPALIENIKREGLRP